MKKLKSFYVISALQHDSSPLGKLVRHATQKEAEQYADEVIKRRAREGSPSIPFHVLKVVSIVESVAPPVRVKRLK